MQPGSVQPQTPFQRFMVEKALALAQELEAVSGAAPAGQVLDVAEGMVLVQGRQFLRDTLQAYLQAQAEQAEKKGRRCDRVSVATDEIVKGKASGSC